jgi:serine/threonine protein kinase
LKELQLPSIASLRAIAALRSPHLALVRPARIGLGFEAAGTNQKSLAEIEELLGGPGRLSLSYSLRWLLDVLAGLGVLHRTLGFVHGEVQPENIVLGEDGVGRLVPVVRAHWVRGEERTPEHLYYLAPEKLLGDNVDVRADVFSVGVMLWEALSGQRLLEAYTVDDIIARLMGGGIPRARPPEGESWTAPLAAIAERALAVDPGKRFGSVSEMKATIEGVCQRYLASPPGMAELFQNPQLRARSYVRDSLPPESQRVTVPPDDPVLPEVRSSATAADLDAAAERLSRSSFLPPDPEEDSITRVNAPPAATARPAPAADVPVVRPARHVNTLLGVPMPAITPRDPTSGPESVTTPFARPIPSTPPPVVIPTVSPSASDPPPAPLPFGKTRTQFNEDPTRPEERRRPASQPPSTAAALAAAPAARVREPSFELVRPRKRHGALWLALGAAAAIALFAARSWLVQQVPSSGPPGEAEARTASDAARNAAALAAPAPSATIASPVAVDSTPVGIASTPAVPSERSATTARPTPHEEHVVIHDRVEPEPPPPAPPAAPMPVPEPPKPPPAAEPPPTPPPPPAPKPRQVPVSDADRYGI